MGNLAENSENDVVCTDEGVNWTNKQIFIDHADKGE